MALNPSALKGAGRVAGFWYLVWAIMGMFSLLYVSPKILVTGDAAATGAKVLAHEFLFKTNIMIGLAGIVVTLVLMWALYRLFAPVNERQAKLMVALFVVTVPASFVMEAFNIASLMIFKGEMLKSFEVAQRQELAMLFLGLVDYATIAFIMFWGLWLFPLALLVYRSRFLPRFLSVWLAINGVAYVLQCVTSLMWPSYKSMIFTYSMPAMFGELAFAIWLVVRGANVKPTHDPAIAPGD